MKRLNQFVAASACLFLMSTAFAEAPSSGIPLAAVRYYLNTDMVIKIDNQTSNNVYVEATVPNTFTEVIPGGVASTYTIEPLTTKTFTIGKMAEGLVQQSRAFEIFSNKDVPEDNATYHCTVQQGMKVWSNDPNDTNTPASLSSYAISPERSPFNLKITSGDVTSVTIVPNVSG